MWNICFIKNISGNHIIVHGKSFNIDEVYKIPDETRLSWANDDNVIAKIVSRELQVICEDYELKTISDEINYLKNINLNAVTQDKKLISLATPRPLGTYTYFTSCDDYDNLIRIIHEENDPEVQVFYFDFNTENNKTYIREGYVSFYNALNDTITFEIVSRETSVTQGQNTNFKIYNNYLIIPANGDGDVTISSTPYFVECVENEFGDKPMGFWDKNFNAYPYGNGTYNLFSQETTLFRFVNKVCLLGNGVIHFRCDDTSRLGEGMRLKVTAITNGTHAWQCSSIITMYRQKTI